MPTLTVSRTIGAPADVVWGILSDFADVSWIPVATDVQVAGEGPGMTRTIQGSAPTPVVERLDRIEPDRKTLAYEIENNPLPVSKFRAVATVSADTQAPCATVTWEVDYEPDGEDAAARGGIESIYGAMAGWLEEAARAR